MTNYEIGFLNKCAEYGLDADVSMALLEKEAFKVKVPGKAAIRKGAKRVGDSLKTYWGHLSGKTARRAGEAKDVALNRLEKVRVNENKAFDRFTNARKAEQSARDSLSKAKAEYAKHRRLFGGTSMDDVTRASNEHRHAANRVEVAEKLFDKTHARHLSVGNQASDASKAFDKAKHTRNVVRGRTAAGVVGTGGTVAAVSRRGKKGGQEKKSEAYLRGFAEKCAEYGLDDSQSLELLKRAYRIGPFRGVSGSAGDTGFSAGFGGGTVHAGIENPSRGGFAIGGHTSRELNHNTAAGAIAGALIGLLREKFRGENEKKHYLRSALLGSLLGGGAGGAYTMATSAPSAVDAISGLLGKARGGVDQAGDAIG